VSRSNWKEAERRAAKMIDGQRYGANTGGLVDVESAFFVGQVKERKNLSLAQLEALVRLITEVGKTKGKAGIVLVKRSAGSGNRTPWLVVMDEDAFRKYRQDFIRGVDDA